MDFLAWVLDQLRTAGPVLSVLVVGGSVIFIRVLWMQHIRDVADMKANARAQIRAQVADARATAKLARAIGELTAKIQSRR